MTTPTSPTIVETCTVTGIIAHPFAIHFETVRAPGLTVHGLGEAATKETSLRVRSALRRAGVTLADRGVRAIIPPDVQLFDPTMLDLPLAVGVLAEVGTIDREKIRGVLFAGELSLDGVLRGKVRGAVPMAQLAGAVQKSIILPLEASRTACMIEEATVISMNDLVDVVRCFSTDTEIVRERPMYSAKVDTTGVDFSEIRGLHKERRAMEIAAAGGHNVLLVGAPGSGKALLARALVGILPAMTDEERRTVAAIYSSAGRLEAFPSVVSRPFRAPHHDVSVAGLVGGGPVVRPGEATLAHNGVLFLDELAEFRRDSLEALRPVFHDRNVTLVRKRAGVTFPADFLTVGAMLPCPCGYQGSSVRVCSCGEGSVARYRSRIAPLEGRFALHVELPYIDMRALRESPDGESSAAIRLRVEAARAIQAARGVLNGRMMRVDLANWAPLDRTGHDVIRRIAHNHNSTAVTILNVHRIARTVADLAGAETISALHIVEAFTLAGVTK